VVTENEEVTLMDWGNCIISNIQRENEIVVSMTGTLHLSGDFKTTKRKLTWLPCVESHPLVTVNLVEYDTLVFEKDIPKDKDFKDFVTKPSIFITPALTDPNIKVLKVGDKIQFERMGYFILDEISEDTYSFIQFPDGHQENKFLSCKVSARK